MLASLASNRRIYSVVLVDRLVLVGKQEARNAIRKKSTLASATLSTQAIATTSPHGPLLAVVTGDFALAGCLLSVSNGCSLTTDHIKYNTLVGYPHQHTDSRAM